MDTLTLDLTPAHAAGIREATKAFNAALPKDEVGKPIGALSEVEYATKRFGEAMDSWARAAIELPAFAFVQRFTAAEYGMIVEVGKASPAVQAYLDDLAQHPTVWLDSPLVIAGLQALTDAGLLAAGRMAEILTP